MKATSSPAIQLGIAAIFILSLAGIQAPAAMADDTDDLWTTGASFEDDDKAFLGIYMTEDDKAGLLVGRTVKGSPAEKGGLKAGDRIVVLQGHEINSEGDLSKVLAHLKPGDVAKLKVIRNGEPVAAKVKLGSKSAYVAGGAPHIQLGEIEEEDVIVGENGEIIIKRGGQGGKPRIIRKKLHADEDENVFFFGEEQDASSDKMTVGVYVSEGKNGVLITDVVKGGPAARAGIAKGDEVIIANGKEIASSDALVKVIASTKPGKAVSMKVFRKGKIVPVKVKPAPWGKVFGKTSAKAGNEPFGEAHEWGDHEKFFKDMRKFDAGAKAFTMGKHGNVEVITEDFDFPGGKGSVQIIISGDGNVDISKGLGKHIKLLIKGLKDNCCGDCECDCDKCEGDCDCDCEVECEIECECEGDDLGCAEEGVRQHRFHIVRPPHFESTAFPSKNFHIAKPRILKWTPQGLRLPDGKEMKIDFPEIEIWTDEEENAEEGQDLKYV